MRGLLRRAVCTGLLALSTAACRCQSAPDAPDELISARAAIDGKRWPEADKLLQAYLAQHQTSPEAHYLLALTLLNEHQPKESLAEYTHAAHLAQPSAAQFRYIALDYVLLNDYADADTWMTRSVEEDSNDGESWYMLGRIKYTENRFSESIAAFRKSLAVMPRSVKAENNLGLALEGLNQPEEAIKAYQQAIAWQAGDPHPSEQPLINLGLLLTDRNQLEEALPLLVQAEALAPKDGRVHAALGKLYRRREDLPKAQAELEQAVAIKPTDSGLHFELAQVYRRRGMAEQAKQELACVAELNGTHSTDK